MRRQVRRKTQRPSDESPGEHGGTAERRYSKINSHLTCGASQRRLWTSREARPFGGTSWLARTHGAGAVLLGVQRDCARPVVALREVSVLLLAILALALHVNLYASAPRALCRKMAGSPTRRVWVVACVGGAHGKAQTPQGGRPSAPHLRRFTATIADHASQRAPRRLRGRLCYRLAITAPRPAYSFFPLVERAASAVRRDCGA